MQTEQVIPTESLYLPVVVGEGQEFDFTALESGTPIRVSPKLIDDLTVGGNNRRKKERSEEFANNIQANGVIQSLSVRPHVDNPNRLELCAGYGRRDMALRFDLDSVPVIVNHYSDREALEIMYSENAARENITIVDEADLAQNYLSYHDGDYATAAVALGLSEKTFRERLQLKRLTDNVLDQLADPSNKFSLGHALILSTFDAETQEKTLAAILANPTEYTVKNLKLRASQRQIPLAKAPFDTKACDRCIHNTGEQLDLLGNGDTDAKCSKASCFIEKAQLWVKNERTPELEEKYGRVIAWEAKPESDRRTVTEEAVGKKQFTSGCMSCESKCTVVDDRPMKWGEYVQDQCIDTDCFNGCVSTLKAEKAEKARKQKEAREAKAKAKAAALEQQTESSNVDAADQPTDETKVTVEQEEVVVNTAPVQRKTSAAVLEDYRKSLRATSASVAVNDPQFRMATALAALCDVSGFEPPVEAIKDNRWPRFNDRVLAYMDLSLQQIQEYMAQAVIHHATVGDKNSNTDLMINVLGKNPNGQSIAIEAWKPSKERLGMYNIAQINQMCIEAGFDKAYEAANGEASFSQLFKNRKNDIVSGVMDFNFDWSHFAPSDYLALVR
ncbi:ParB/RepB/Spo0J family partition protein [Vibrio parahaemolyticus]|uniref:ParB/RepB/Spo0J family partition protein n=1 Tax=Vibrio TaxID=662 RepID=UPI001A8EA12E|nr:MULTISPECIES: ParB/RepB/Spo0J family partition protein [Vibrio]EGQ7973560.1 ParB/RepB/Spo0J family partition protein [Vibrio parahaemolyticus]MBO0208538.1 ParB/RepB/Spo0J family partition protein [Vibrio sp. Vb0877]MCR9809169.1 ParB/RepB/Spo0J family partition protein [Vibrio parahaemolyticus]MDW2323158.1 ParB/RepB/Spo0J family partition protein [Vibrio sp. 1159]